MFKRYIIFFITMFFVILGSIYAQDTEKKLCMHPYCMRKYPAPFKDIDTNQDGKIDVAEWYQYKGIDKKDTKFVPPDFQELDKDEKDKDGNIITPKDGFISPQELDQDPLLGSAKEYIQGEELIRKICFEGNPDAEIPKESEKYYLCWEHRGIWKCERKPGAEKGKKIVDFQQEKDDAKPSRIRYKDEKTGKEIIGYNPDFCEVPGCYEAWTKVFVQVENGRVVEEKKLCLGHYIKARLDEKSRRDPQSLYVGLVILTVFIGIAVAVVAQKYDVE